MELELVRTYFPNGCNGELFINGKRLCFTIELPWLDNEPLVSCIPEGRYVLVKRYSRKFCHHLLVKDVPGRALILIHAANDAQAELKGCIAPVSYLTAEGKGTYSKRAFNKLTKLVFAALMDKKPVFLIIKSKDHELE
jgi:hypothetical protein